jgi:hypothetical protein
MNDFHPLILSVTVSLSSLNVSDTGILLDIVHCLELAIDTQCLGVFLYIIGHSSLSRTGNRHAVFRGVSVIS